MAAHFQGRLDLDKFRKFREKNRKSLGLPISREHSPPPEDVQISQRHQSTDTMINNEINPFQEKRKLRFNKFRERRRESHSPSLKTSEQNITTGQHGQHAVEGSPLRPIVLGEQSSNRLGKSAASSPLQQDDSTYASRRSLGTNSTAPLSHVSSHASTRSSGRDRIEESRVKNYDMYNKKAENHFQASKNWDRVIKNRNDQVQDSHLVGNRGATQQQKPFGRHSLDGSTRYSANKTTMRDVRSRRKSSEPSMSMTNEYGSSQSRAGSAAVGSTYSNHSSKSQPSHPRLDQRTVRLLYAQNFASEIAHHRKEKLFVEDQNENEQPANHVEKSFNFYVRKQAISPRDTARGDFDVVVVEPDVSQSVIVYETEIKPDLKTKAVTPFSYQTDKAFSEHCSSEEFYVRVGQPLVRNAKQGGMATAIVFGQNDSGKDTTMAEIEERVAFDVYEPFESSAGVYTERPASVALQLVEIVGNKCTDLLGHSKSTVQVVAKEGGAFRIKGAETRPVSSAKDLIGMLVDAKLQRAEDYRRKGSLPSCHMLCQIFIRQEGRRGSLTLLECAGMDFNESESVHAYDQDSKSSFNNLMECVRARSMGRKRENSYIPYRSCNLTKILQENLDREDSRVSVVASVSPLATDTEATMATLKTVFAPVRVGGDITTPSKSKADDLVLPRQWNHAELRSFLLRKQLLGKDFPSDVNGRLAFRMSKVQLKSTFYEKWDDAQAEKLYIALRAENDRIARIRVKRRIALEKKSDV